MRVAWMGPTPTDDSGVPYVAAQILEGLGDAGVELDCFVAAEPGAVPERLRAHSHLSFVCGHRWERDWHRRAPLLDFVTGQSARALAEGRLIGSIARRHAQRPYDVLYHFSRIELGPARTLRGRLPPLVLHPEVHAAGELRWLRRERALVRRCESNARRLAIEMMLSTRATIQRRDMRLARLIVAPSRLFADQLSDDYGVASDRLKVVPNPIDLCRFAPVLRSRRAPGGPVTLLFVSRISVRKGVEMIVGLSRRLADLAGQARILVVGDRTMWSDYRPLLTDLDPRIATYRGPAAGPEVAELHAKADVLLQPAHYEPFALSVGEALASGLAVVASDRVGAVEQLDGPSVRRFPDGELDALETAVREMLRLVRERPAEIARAAREQAEQYFAPARVAAQLVGCLEQARGTV
jgi:glycosyltransferase involved in cell wall biosynthesis